MEEARPRDRREHRLAALRLPEEHLVSHHLSPQMTGMEVAAVTSMVLTNSAATQVETVLNSSAVIVFPFHIR